MSGCVYKIQNVKNGKLYVGQTKNFKQRVSEHKYCLKNNIHSNPDLQQDYNIYMV